MGRPANIIPRIVVEDCEIVTTTDTSACARLGVRYGLVPNTWKRSAVVPAQSAVAEPSNFIGPFTCRHSRAELATILAIPTSVQRHDARLDWLLKISDLELRRVIDQGREHGLETPGHSRWIYSIGPAPKILTSEMFS